ncbi:MAG: hypothetical protein C6I01_04275 [Epsilonproteobacteria bacterium]|jgi:uncharacterized protein (TIGR00251 family)|nr:hypothetical protein [Campylobacterota bacterium]NPA88819.1 DUF167 domain-containing protein [Campylobacterota bacterium]
MDGSWYKISDNYALLKIWVQPNASRTKILGEYNGYLKVALQVPPLEGRANGELIKLFSKKFKIPKSQIQLKGEKSRKKELTLPLTPQLKEFLGEK